MSMAQLRLLFSHPDGTLCEDCGYIFNDIKPGFVLFGKLNDGTCVWVRFISGGRNQPPKPAGYRSDTGFHVKLTSVTSSYCDEINLSLLEANDNPHGARGALRMRLCEILIKHYEHIDSPSAIVANYKRLDDYLEVLKWAVANGVRIPESYHVSVQQQVQCYLAEEAAIWEAKFGPPVISSSNSDCSRRPNRGIDSKPAAKDENPNGDLESAAISRTRRSANVMVNYDEENSKSEDRVAATIKVTSSNGKAYVPDNVQEPTAPAFAQPAAPIPRVLQGGRAATYPLPSRQREFTVPYTPQASPAPGSEPQSHFHGLRSTDTAQPDPITSPLYTALDESMSINDVKTTLASLDNVITQLRSSWRACPNMTEKPIWRQLLDEKERERQRFTQKVRDMMGIE